MIKIVYFAVALLIIGSIGTAITIPKTNTLEAIGLFPDRTEPAPAPVERGATSERTKPPKDLDGTIQDFQEGIKEGTAGMAEGIMDEVAGAVDEAVSTSLSGMDDDMELPRDDFAADLEIRSVSLSESMDVKGIREVVIQTAAADVLLQIADSASAAAELKGKVRSDVTDDELTPLLARQGDKLYVVAERARENGGDLHADLTLTVRLPKRSFDKVSVTTASGRAEASGLLVKQAIAMQTASGDVKLTGAKAARITLGSSSGSVEASDLQGDIDANSVSGDLHLDLTREPLTGNVSTETVSGDIEVALKKSQAVALRFDTVTGDGQVDLPGIALGKQTDQEIEGQVGDAEFNVQARTTTGDFSLK